MSGVCVVATADSGSADAASAIRSTITSAWPDVDVKVLTSAGVTAPEDDWDAVRASAADGSGYADSAILRETDQLALALPAFISGLLADYDACLYIGPERLMVRRPSELLNAAEQRGAAVVVPGTVTPKYSLTPSLGPLEAGPFLPDKRVVAVTKSGRDFLADWITTAREAVLDIDQRSVSWACDTFLQRSISRSDVVVEGESTFLHWADYAAVEASRATGPAAALIAADDLFASAREIDLSDDPEVAWSMLVHRVHDSRPVERFLEIIRAAQPIRRAHTMETPYDILRADIRHAADPFGKKWRVDDEEGFDNWLYDTNSAGCTRLADLTIKTDPALLRRFPRARLDPHPFRQWVQEHGRLQLGFDPFDPSFLPRAEAEVEEEGPHSTIHAMAWRWNAVKSLIPGYTRRATRRLDDAYLGADPGPTRGLAPPRAVEVVQNTPLWGEGQRHLNLLGPFRSESGLGQAARASLEAVRLMGLPFTHVDTTEKYPSRNSVDVGLTRETLGQWGDVNFIHSNADEIITLGDSAFKHRFGGRFNAAMWFWETADLPQRSRPAFHIVDELWVASEYQRDVFGQYAQVPVHVIGLAAELPREREVDRSKFGWREDELVFLFVYDALSSYGRKNPRMAIDAFIAAFSPHFDNVRFILKVSNLNKFPASQREILGLADQYSSISVIDEYLAREEVMDLMAAADVYVSLHAAEGFGLTLLEAMALGTPVICTAYSGNMDFTTQENSWLVGYDMMQIQERTGPYPEGSIWARPRLDDAIDAMRHVGMNRGEIQLKSERAHRDAVEAASLDRYAARLNEHLNRVL